jgi:transcriptional regulator with XRE-family HTH domain
VKPEAFNVVRSLPFHRYVRAARMRRTLTGQAVADYIGVSASFYADIEAARRPLRGDGKLRLLSEILKVPIEVLEEKAGLMPWGREPWFAIAVDDTLRTSVRFLPSARRAFRDFDEKARALFDRLPLPSADRTKLQRALDELALMIGDGHEND